MLTVGQILSNIRKEKNIALKDAERQTRIRKRYLAAIEQENWSLFTSRVYIAGAIKTYASFLGLDPAKAMAYFRRDYEKKESTTFKKRLPRLQFLPESKKMVIGALSTVFLLFVFYFGYQINQFVSPPEVQIITPEKRIFRNLEKITVVGVTQKESVITIFNETIFPNEQGIFTYDFPLKKGANTLQMSVEGPNGKVTNKTLQFTLE